MFETTTFDGTLSGHGYSQPVVFTAEVNEEGVLSVRLGRMPFSKETHSLFRSPEPTQPIDRITLDGVAASGTTFHSDSFSILHFSHTSIVGQELDFQGSCAVADITRIAAEPNERSSKVWLMKKFGTYHRIKHEIPLGTVVIGGMDDSADSQVPRGFLHLLHRDGIADEEWLAESERFLIHAARVMSFACGTYLVPVVERLFHGEVDRLRVVRRGRAVRPNMAPFSPMHLEPIFALACDTYATRPAAVAAIDAAVRWLTMPVTTWESELINAMTALENLLETQQTDGAGLFQKAKQFEKTAKAVRGRLRELEVDDGMIEKVPELNRRSFKDKLDRLLAEWNVATADFPDDWRRQMINTRNNIIHTGTLPEALTAGPGVPGHVIWAREIATRLILQILGFEGGFQSWLHKDRTLHFPSCRPIEQVVQA